MNRAEMRRFARKNMKKEKVYTLTQSQIDKIKADVIEEAVDVSFGLMLSIPADILARDYWEKTASKRVPEFLDKCLSLYESLGAGVINLSDLIADVEEVGKLKMNLVERIKRLKGD